LKKGWTLKQIASPCRFVHKYSFCWTPDCEADCSRRIDSACTAPPQKQTLRPFRERRVCRLRKDLFARQRAELSFFTAAAVGTARAVRSFSGNERQWQTLVLRILYFVLPSRTRVGFLYIVSPLFCSLSLSVIALYHKFAENTTTKRLQSVYNAVTIFVVLVTNCKEKSTEPT
jgi:hypothetical protein